VDGGGKEGATGALSAKESQFREVE